LVPHALETLVSEDDIDNSRTVDWRV
jgi:hypothetical protein